MNAMKQARTCTINLDSPEAGLLRTLVLADLESLNELPSYDKREPEYQEEYAQIYQLAERLGAKLARPH